MDGMVLRGEHAGEEFVLEKSNQSQYSIHVEYDYIDKKKDAVILSTLLDSYFVYPLSENSSVTKISLAVEELYNLETKPR